jgi:ABC-type oligopeptide transport system ATPase subunit
MGERFRTTDLRRQFRLGDTVVRAVDGVDMTVAEGEFPVLLLQRVPASQALAAE